MNNVFVLQRHDTPVREPVPEHTVCKVEKRLGRYFYPSVIEGEHARTVTGAAYKIGPHGEWRRA